MLEVDYNLGNGIHLEYVAVDNSVGVERSRYDSSGAFHIDPGGLGAVNLSPSEEAAFWAEVDSLGIKSWQRYYGTTQEGVESGEAEWMVIASDSSPGGRHAGDRLYPALDPPGEPTREGTNGFSALIDILEKALEGGRTWPPEETAEVDKPAAAPDSKAE